MTIAISLKVNDGVVLAADSASSILARTEQGDLALINIYDNANKIFNPYKGLPIGITSWGSGSIGQSSISTLVKDFRRKITTERAYNFDPNKYTIKGVADSFKQFIFDENYVHEFKDWKTKPKLGFIVAGYSSGEILAEEWKIDINERGECKEPQLLRNQKEIGVTWSGEPEALSRLIMGHSTVLPELLKDIGTYGGDMEKIIKLMRKNLAIPFITAAMPIQDAIDLAIYFVQTTIGFSRFSPGATTVGGPIEVAAITKHEYFKWVKRKHYFDISLNPEEEKNVIQVRRDEDKE